MKFKKSIYILLCVLFMETLTPPALEAHCAGNPVLALKANGQETYTAQPGESVYLTYEISGGSEWSTSGVHFNYDARLVPDNDGKGNIYYSKGEAINDMLMIQVYQRTGEDINNNIVTGNPAVTDISPYVSREQNCIFVTTFAAGNTGADGVVIGINMTVPEDAKEGDEYKFNFWSIDSDQFTDSEGNKEMREYAFNNFKDCSIKIGSSVSKIKGDATLNGTVDMADVITVAAYVSDPKGNAISEQSIINSDVHSTGNGVDANDVLMIQQYISNIIDSLE